MYLLKCDIITKKQNKKYLRAEDHKNILCLILSERSERSFLHGNKSDLIFVSFSIFNIGT